MIRYYLKANNRYTRVDTCMHVAGHNLSFGDRANIDEKGDKKRWRVSMWGGNEGSLLGSLT